MLIIKVKQYPLWILQKYIFLKIYKSKRPAQGKTKGKWQQRKPQSIVYILCQDSLLEVFDHVLQLSPDSGWISWSFVSREALFRWLWSNPTSAFALRATLLALLFEVYQICLRCMHVAVHVAWRVGDVLEQRWKMSPTTMPVKMQSHLNFTSRPVCKK